MSLQFADFDADGHQDIITAIWQGSAYLVRGGESGWQAPEPIQDKSGQGVLLSTYYDFEDNQYKEAEHGPADDAETGDHCVSAYALDWEGDGDLDLLLGAKEGKLFLRRNGGEAGKPAFGTGNELLELEDGSPFVVKGGLTAARAVDWDADGLDDLVCGSFEGGAYWYRNVGAKGAPLFGLPVTLVAPPEDTGDGAVGPVRDWYVTPVDYDGDGDLDLVVGGHFTYAPEPRTLSEEEQAELERLRARSEELMEQLQGIYEALEREYEGKPQEELQAAAELLMESPEMNQRMEEMQAVRTALSKLSDDPERTSGIWLYRRELRG